MEIDINLKNSECTDLPLLLPLDVPQIDHSLQSPLLRRLQMRKYKFSPKLKNHVLYQTKQDRDSGQAQGCGEGNDQSKNEEWKEEF